MGRGELAPDIAAMLVQALTNVGTTAALILGGTTAATSIYQGEKARHPLDQVKGSQFETCPTCKAMLAARRELVDLATPIYKARMCVDPFYKAREGAPLSWSSLVGSAVVVSRALVAYELGLATYQGTAAAPWTPRTEAL